MDKRTRSRLEMCARALEFSQAHPDPSNGYTATVAELAGLLARAQQLTDLHREGVAEVRAATAQKRKLRRSIRQSHMRHVGLAAQRAAREVPELAEDFALAREPIPYLAFENLARAVAAEAEGRKELLVKHGLVEQVLVGLKEGLSQFGQAMQRAAEGRRIHIAAAVELDVVSGNAVGVVKLIDSHNRVRFASDPDLMAAWKSASNIIGPSRPAAKLSTPVAPPSTGDIRPAA